MVDLAVFWLNRIVSYTPHNTPHAPDKSGNFGRQQEQEAQ